MSRLGEQVLTLVLCWSQSGEHLGEGIRVLADGPRSGWWTFGSGSCEGEGETLQLTRQRPGRIEARPFENPVLARAELGLCAEPHGIDVRALRGARPRSAGRDARGGRPTAVHLQLAAHGSARQRAGSGATPVWLGGSVWHRRGKPRGLEA